MERRSTIIFIVSLSIIAVVSGVVYVEWQEESPAAQQPPPPQAVVIATSSGLTPRSARDSESLIEDPRVTAAREQCNLDLNGDGKCDSLDTALLREAIGACKGEAKYSELADIDHDGCVTWSDQEQIFPMFKRDNDLGCDLDRDGDCDRNDYDIFLASTRECFDMKPYVDKYRFKRAYNPLADANRDGCVLGGDRRLLFPVIPEK